jgi:hypothetical protein
MTKEFFDRGKWIAKWADNQPEWQELTDDEIMHIARESYMSRDGGDIKFARAIEQALREKNFLGINKAIFK